jgi:hypothetical protein
VLIAAGSRVMRSLMRSVLRSVMRLDRITPGAQIACESPHFPATNKSDK